MFCISPGVRNDEKIRVRALKPWHWFRSVLSVCCEIVFFFLFYVVVRAPAPRREKWLVFLFSLQYWCTTVVRSFGVNDAAPHAGVAFLSLDVRRVCLSSGARSAGSTHANFTAKCCTLCCFVLLCLVGLLARLLGRGRKGSTSKWWWLRWRWMGFSLAVFWCVWCVYCGKAVSACVEVVTSRFTVVECNVYCTQNELQRVREPVSVFPHMMDSAGTNIRCVSTGFQVCGRTPVVSGLFR